MRRLLLARHAKSSWDHPELRDHDRPLNGRGKRAAPAVAAALRARDFIPDLVCSSTSARTVETWEAMEDALGPRPRVEFHPDLYLSSPGQMLGVISRRLPTSKR